MHVEFSDSHRPQMRALLQVLLAGAWTGGPPAPMTAPLEGILRQRQDAGECRDVGPHVMAVTVQGAVEGLPWQLGAEPDLDCAAHARELVTLFALATRA